MLFGGETAASHYEEGLTVAMKGHLEQASQHFVRALELDAGLYSARHQLGKCLLRMGQLEKALKHLQKAARKLPMLSPPQVDMGFALLALNHVDEAREAFAEALRIKQDDARAVLGLAFCAFQAKQWETATGLAQRALDMGRRHFDAHYLLARAADKADMLDIATNHYQKAIAVMEQSIETNPDQVAGYYLRGCAYFAMQHYVPALSDFEAATERAEEDRHYCAYHEHFNYTDMLAMLGRCLKELKQPEKAAKIGRHIVARAPNHEIGRILMAEDANEAEMKG